MLDPFPAVRGQFIAAQLRPFVHLGRSIITLGDAIEIVGVAEDVPTDLAEAAGGHGAPMWRSHALLTTNLESLKVDDQGGSTTPSPAP